MMHRVSRSVSTWILPTMVTLLAVGCTEPAVGDPCTPENIPAGGFDSQESYIETQSVECRTRVCVVYDFDGDPTWTREDCVAAGGEDLTDMMGTQLLGICDIDTYAECELALSNAGITDFTPCGPSSRTSEPPEQMAVDDGIYCSCRCDAPAGSDAPTCECPGGYSCTEILEIGDDGLRGSYCVKD